MFVKFRLFGVPVMRLTSCATSVSELQMTFSALHPPRLTSAGRA